MEKPRLHSSPEERLMAQQIVVEELGGNFWLNFDLYPHNKGIKGDEGVYGETVEIEGNLPDPAQFLANEHELLANLAGKLCGKIPAITKVLFNLVVKDPYEI